MANPHTADTSPADNESITGLIRGIFDDLSTLIREEIALARVEIREQVAKARTMAAALAIGAVALMFGGMFLLVAVALGVADLLNWPAWTGFLIVAVLLMAVGAVSLSSARSKLAKLHAVPVETMTSVKENSAWIAKRMSSVRR
jgi:hypothetical protein